MFAATFHNRTVVGFKHGNDWEEIYCGNMRSTAGQFFVTQDSANFNLIKLSRLTS